MPFTLGEEFPKVYTIHSCGFRHYYETLSEQLREVDSQSHQDRSKGKQEAPSQQEEEGTRQGRDVCQVWPWRKGSV